jgi:hypothetical protein
MERFYSVHVERIVYVRVPLDGRSLHQFGTVSHLHDEFLVLHVAMGETRELAALPGVVANIDTVVERAEEEETVHDHAELVDVPELNRVHSLHHFD